MITHQKDFIMRIKQIDYQGEKIRYNRDTRVEMRTLLDFLTVPVQRKILEQDSRGWTTRIGENGLKISGAIIAGKEYVDALEYKSNLFNPYNNFVNVFALFDILSKEGCEYFLNLYKDEIDKLKRTEQSNIERAQKSIDFWSTLQNVV